MDSLDVLLGIGGTILGLVFSYLAFFRNSKKDSKDDGKATGTVLTELGYIKSGIDDLKSENREQRKTNIEVITRLTAVESSSKQAHHRIDRLEERGNNEKSQSGSY